MAAAGEGDEAGQEGDGGATGSDLPPEQLLSEPEFWDKARRLAELPPQGVINTSKPIWASVARRAQLPPPGAWRQWLMIGGRGSGKTRAGAEWVRAMAAGEAPFAARPHGRIALIAETLGDAREVMIDGESGLLAVGAGSAAGLRGEPAAAGVCRMARSRRSSRRRTRTRCAATSSTRLGRRAGEMGAWRGVLRQSAVRRCGWASGRGRCSPRRRGRSRS